MVLPQVGILDGLVDLFLEAKAVDSSQTSPYYTENGLLRVDDNGEFNVLQLADIQNCYPIPDESLYTIRCAIKQLNPSLIVLTGDNVWNTNSDAAFKATVDQIVAEFHDQDG